MNKKLKKEIIEWTVILTVIALLVSTGLGAKVASFLQRGILQTGLMTPDILSEEEYKDAAYDFNFSDEQGNIIHFSTLKGKTIFVNFWATWCPPCIAEMPDIDELYTELKDHKNIAFVIISVDSSPEKAFAFKKKKEFNMPVYFLESRLPEVYDAHSIPTTYVISPTGKIVSERHGMAKYTSDHFKNFLKNL